MVDWTAASKVDLMALWMVELLVSLMVAWMEIKLVDLKAALWVEWSDLH